MCLTGSITLYCGPSAELDMEVNSTQIRSRIQLAGLRDDVQIV